LCLFHDCPGVLASLGLKGLHLPGNVVFLHHSSIPLSPSFLSPHQLSGHDLT
jgi:hypothetical protein